MQQIGQVDYRRRRAARVAVTAVFRHLDQRRQQLVNAAQQITWHALSQRSNCSSSNGVVERRLHAVRGMQDRVGEDGQLALAKRRKLMQDLTVPFRIAAYHQPVDCAESDFRVASRPSAEMSTGTAA